MPFKLIITPEMKKKFQSETARHLDDLETMLLRLEENPEDSEAVSSAFRAVHSIKGNSDYLGVKDINTLANGLEELMDDIRAGRVQADAPATAILFEGLDLLRDMNRRVASEDYRESDVTGLVSRIARLKAQASEKGGRPEIRESPGKKVDVAAVFHRSALQQIEYMRESANRILQGDVSEKNRPNILRILKSFHVSANYGGFQAIAALLDEMKQRLEKENDFGKKTAGYLLEKCEELLRLADEIGSREGPSGKTTSPGADAKMDDLFREVRLSPPKIDRIIDVATRMGIAHSRLSYLVEQGRDIREGDCVRDELKRTARQIGRITQELQVGAMALRLASINMIFERLPRIVRDIGLEEGKKVDLALSGADVELDRKVVEQLVDPLIHLVRNAVDHGIESPARRKEKGKPERGAIAVSASHEGNRVVVEVSDDGQGIDPEEIRRTAVEKKMFFKEKIDSMSSGDLLNLLFMPGYTTASCETKVSGRGVGLDIVKNNLKSVGGNVTVSSTPGAETRVRLQVPVSIAMLEVLICEVQNERYAFPMSGILENIKVKNKDLQAIDSARAVAFRGEILGIKRLAEILEIPGDTEEQCGDEDREVPVVVVGFGGKSLGVAVDRIVRSQSIVTKPLQKHFDGIGEFSGAALLGDGDIVLVLDPMALVR